MTTAQVPQTLDSLYFDETYYLENNPDVLQAVANGEYGSGLQHFEDAGQFENRQPSPWFNPKQYLIDNPDVLAAVNAGASPSAWAHFITYGVGEDRSDGTFVGTFDDAAYLAANPDVAAAVSDGVFQNGYEHFLRYGLYEGRYATNMAGTPISIVTGKTFTLTSGLDNGPAFSGGARNDAFNATEAINLAGVAVPTWTSGDVIDGGGGADSFNVVQTAAISNPLATTVRNIKTGNFTTGSTVKLDTTVWTGLAALNTASVGSATLTSASGTDITATTTALAGKSDITIDGGRNVTATATGSTAGAGINIGTTTAPTGTIVVDDTVTNTSGNQGADITVFGGSTVDVTETAGNAVNSTVTFGAVDVHGTESTNEVTVSETARQAASSTQPGVTDDSIAVSDVNASSPTDAGTITSISASNYTVLGIADNNLQTLDLTGGSGNIIIDNSGLDAPTNTTLALTMNGLTGGTLDDADIYTTLNVTTVGKNSTLANITDSALTNLTIAGSAVMTLTSTAGLTALDTVTVSGGAGVRADFSSPTVSAIDTSATTGASTITMNAGNATFSGGAGVDTVTTTSAAPSQAISLGAGDDSLTLGSNILPTAPVSGGTGVDTLTMDATFAATSSGSSAFAQVVSGFEKLRLTGATNQTVDLDVLGISGAVSTRAGNGMTLTNLVNGGTLTLTGAGTAYTIANAAFNAGTNDVINLTLSDNSGAGVAFASTGITASKVETVAITTVDGQLTPSGSFNDSVTLLGNSAKTITVTGNAGLTLTATDTAATKVDASGISLGGFTFTSGALQAASVIKGSQLGSNTVDFSAANAVVTYTGGSGDDNITATNSQANVVSLGDGDNSYNSQAGNQTVTAGSGNDTVIATTGNNSVSLGDGNNSFTATSGNNTYTGGDGVDTVTLGGGTNSVTLGAGANTLSLTAANTSLSSLTTVLDPTAGDTISFANFGTETFGTTAVTSGTQTLQGFADAVVQAGGNASVNGHFGWFQFGGDTYLAESRHNGTTTPGFQAGTDFMVKLSGLEDLSNGNLQQHAEPDSSLTLDAQVSAGHSSWRGDCPG